MIESIEIRLLRGIKSGRLENLTPLVILVGPNGCGKSTVLDAMLLAGCWKTGLALQYIASRRSELPGGSRWLFWRGDQSATVRTTVKETGSEHARVCTFAIKEEGAGGSTFNLTLRPRSRSGEGDFEIVVPNVPPPEVAIELWRSAAPTDVRLVDLPASASEPKLHDLYSRAKEQARADVAIESLREIIPGFQNIEILTDQGQPVLHVNYDTHTVPAATAGDGVRLLLRTCLELSGRPGGSVLIEEPELHLHPAAIYQTALAIHAAVRRDVQVVLSTHSLELIDALVATAGDDAQIAKMSLYRLGLDAGVLKSSRTPGPDIAFARTTVEDDLR